MAGGRADFQKIAAELSRRLLTEEAPSDEELFKRWNELVEKASIQGALAALRGFHDAIVEMKKLAKSHSVGDGPSNAVKRMEAAGKVGAYERLETIVKGRIEHMEEWDAGLP